MIEIKKYSAAADESTSAKATADEQNMFDMVRDMGADWSDYSSDTAKFARALNGSIVFVAYDNAGKMCGYIRCRDDDGYGIYIYDLLVIPTHRGKNIGRELINRVAAEFPTAPIYAMSDADPYYEKQNFPRIGSVFQVR
jgi:ribosomal protein S18 acetylase RimI-like enzyme